MEQKLSSLQGIGSANINFATKILILEIEEINKTKKLIAAVNDVVKSVEGHASIIEKKHESGVEVIELEEKTKRSICEQAEVEEELGLDEVHAELLPHEKVD